MTPEKKELRTIPSTPVPPTVVTKEKETPAPQTPTPAPVVVKATPAPAMSEGERAIADKQSALDKARESARAAEKKHTDLLKDQQAATLLANASQKAVEDQRKTYTPIKAAADDAAAKRKKLEDDQKAAEAAAQEAQKVATEKARLVEEGKKKLEDSEKDYTDKQAAQEKANADLQATQKTLEEKQKVEADATKAANDADTALQQQQAAVAKREKELEDVKVVLDLNKSLKEKVDQFRGIASTNGLPAPATWVAPATPKPSTPNPIPAATPKVAVATPAPKPATPEPTEMVKLAQTPSATPFLSTPAPATPMPTTPAPSTPMRTTPVPATPVPATPVPATPVPSTPAPATPTPPTPVPAATPGGATPEVTVTNSLGMKFAPVGDVDFCIWLTRVKDFEIFAKEKNLKSNAWRSPGFRQGPDHPVVNVTWDEALAFCAWLTDKEHSGGALPANKFYRLPTDLEWSKAVGLPEEVGRTPEARDMGIPDIYPWGKDWPPPPGAGNYTGEETGSDVAIKGYEDGYAWTSPVGSFKANKYGLYDMGGNVWQWCMDNWNNESKAKVLRGASWYNGALKLSLLSSCRVHAAPDSSTDNYGFRIVRASESASSIKSKFR
ncbi:protein of unknown function DUF323 [Chthoniobacter flavus Ellin428]|uniref:Sulfatase-modifying factor enzyme-like domain-containing protein n=1 Tax=Chthoniobacter flavus Ellin428 TaxID=497964 RepID=B4D404_9BACT|nr:protein of unknown function DUF323 [Chthoniobacter flavus Ellin428]